MDVIHVNKLVGVDIMQGLFIRNMAVENILEASDLREFSNLSEEERNRIRQYLKEGMSKGLNPQEISLNLIGRINPTTYKREGGIITLSSHQKKEVEIIRSFLINFDDKYFELEMRDKRFDKSIKKANSNKIPLTQEKIDKIINSIENLILRRDVGLIVHNEVFKAFSTNEHDSILRSINEGLITKDMVTKWWSNCGDEKVRESHKELGERYNKTHTIPFDEPFVTKSGQKLMYPHDDSFGAPKEEIDGCRCKCEYYIDFLKKWRNK